jgi:hypothetical protein
MLTDEALEAANDAAFQAREYTDESIRAFLDAQDRDALAEWINREVIRGDAPRGLARDVIDALLGEVTA